MRKVVFGINLTLDGCCDHTKGQGNEDVHVYFGELMRTAGTLVYGRITYELMVPYWPDVAKNRSGDTKSINDFAEAFAAVPEIVVFSRTLKDAEAKNTRIVRTDPCEEILAMKQQEGGDIMLGGVDLASQIIQAKLVDEFHIVVQPFIAGEGRRFLDTMWLADQLALKLVETKIFDSGYLALKYTSHK